MTNKNVKEKPSYFRLIRSLGLVFLLFLTFLYIGILSLEHYLKDPIIFSNGKIHLKQIDYQFPFTFQIGSISGKINNIELDGNKTQIKVNPMASLEKDLQFLELTIAKIKINQVDLQVAKGSNPSLKNKPPPDPDFEPISSFELGILFSLQIDSVTYSQNDSLLVSTKNLFIKNLNPFVLNVELGNTLTPYYPFSIKHQGVINWKESQNLHYESKTFIDSDTLSTYIQIPRLFPDSTVISFSYQTQTPGKYFLLPKPISNKLQKFKLEGKYSPFIDSNSVLINSSIKNKAMWDVLPDLDWQISGKGNLKKIKLKVIGSNARSSLNFFAKGMFNNWEIEGDWKNLEYQIGNTILPLDAKLHFAEINSDNFIIDLTTKAESNIKAEGKWDNLSAELNVQVGDFEPWALSWCDSNLELTDASIQANFQEDILQGFIQSDVPNAYGFQSPQAKTTFKLDANSIRFWDGQIITDDNEIDWTGEVVWNDYNGDDNYNYNYKFSTWIEERGNASIYGDQTGDLSLNISDFTLSDLPIIERNWLNQWDGKITASATSNIDYDTAHGFVQYHSNVNGTPYFANAELKQVQKQIEIKSLNLNHLENKLNTSGAFHYDSLIHLDSFSLSTDSFALAILTNTFEDSLMESGQISGNLTYHFKRGFSGLLQGDSLNFFQTEFPNFPRFQIIGIGEELLLDARMKYGPEGIWDSDIAVSSRNIFSDTLLLDAALINDLGGLFWFQSKYIDWQTLIGSTHLSGNWTLDPSGVKISNVGSRGSIRWLPEDGLTGLNLFLENNTGMLNLDEQNNLPFKFDAKFTENNLNLKFVVKNEDNDSLLLSSNYSILQKRILNFYLFSENFKTYIDESSYVQAKNLIGKNISKDGIRLKITSPSFEYIRINKSQGNLITRLSNLNIFYQSAQNEQFAKLQGEADVRALWYENLSLPELHPIELRRIFPSSKTKDTKPSTPTELSNTTLLDIKLKDPGSDSLRINTNLGSIPLTIDLEIKGTTQKPILNGSIAQVEESGIIIRDTTYEITTAEVSWDRNQLMDGKIDIKSILEFNYCSQEQETQDKCPIYLNIDGTLANMVFKPNANCQGNEIPVPRVIMTTLLHCIPDEDNLLDENAGKSYLGTLLGNFVGDGINSISGKKIIKDVNYSQKTNDDGNDSTSVSISTGVPFLSSNWSLKFDYLNLQNTEEKSNFITGGINGTWDAGPGRIEIDAGMVSRPSFQEESGEREVSFFTGLGYIFPFWGDLLGGSADDL